MRDRNGKIIRIGDTLTASYGIPPVGIKATVVWIEKYGQGRFWCETPGHTPTQCSLVEFIDAMGEIEIIKRKYEMVE